MRGTSSISCAERSAGGTGTSRIDVRREDVAEYALEDERTMARMLEVSSAVGRSDVGMDWKRSGYLASVGFGK